MEFSGPVFLVSVLDSPSPGNNWAAKARRKILNIQRKSQESVMAEATSLHFISSPGEVRLLTTVASGHIRLGGSCTKVDQNFHNFLPHWKQNELTSESPFKHILRDK